MFRATTMAQPIDPLRMRLFSELNIQLGPNGITKDLMNEASKHLAFLVRFYVGDPQVDPMRVSVPIIKLPSDPELDLFGLGASTCLNISLVVQELPSAKQDLTAFSTSTPSASPNVAVRGAKEMKKATQTPTPSATPTTRKTSVENTTRQESSAVKQNAATAKTNGTSQSSPAQAAKPPAARKTAKPCRPRPRMRVLIESTGAAGHHKCLIKSFIGVAERVIAGILSDEEEVVNKVDENDHSRKGNGHTKNCGCGNGPVWDVSGFEDCC